jgi:uncharacterized protein YciI
MANFVLSCMDHPDSLDLRLATRPAHLDYLNANQAMVKLAGPLLDETGAMVGSLFILEAASLAEVEAFAAADPYAKAELFASIHARPWRITVGALA